MTPWLWSPLCKVLLGGGSFHLEVESVSTARQGMTDGRFRARSVRWAMEEWHRCFGYTLV